ncbi:peptidoglycan-binding protein [Streptomyces sp. NBC_01261]|uniref:peptidoglycan-binding domain-containing protein n=1 Tax=Streptomyces sp. NBC_01261 TaxID=2903802 RepID=UPI002E32892A|nr:peptidoglycan-binding domain-containing protein [Streptomyces sp. NBC_01261]
MAEHATSRKPRGGRRVGLATALVATAGVGMIGVAAVAQRSSDETGPQAHAAPSVQSAKVVRRDLSNSLTEPGNLGFGPAKQLKGNGPGTLTKLPSNGTETARGKALYRVDDKPVPVFYGDTPFFRDLKKIGLVGNDVSVLRTNLAALGYDVGEEPVVRRSAGRNLEPGATFTVSLAAALKKWQQQMGVEPTGTLKVGAVIVLPGPVRVSELKAQVGDPVAEDILSYVSPKKVITVPVDAQQVSSIKPGDAVTITLPGAKAPGMVTSISHAPSDESGQSDAGDTSKIDVTVLPKRAADVASLDEADLPVEFVSEIHKNVLTVPIGALVALSGGGFAVQPVSGEFLRVRTGMFAIGLVEISGPGLTEGLAVVVAS